ncbi:DUF3810 domain-containing protein [Chryseobacterium gallinarum]|uniref:DUF3810 domain-containing protein n=1 Tax=Chryseobacterium gallinarum TaxID=1324352 RepID=UPI0032AE96C9
MLLKEMDIKITKTIYKKKRFWAGLLLAQFLLFYAFSKLTFMISFFENFFEFQKRIHQLLFSWISFSVGDVIYILLGIFFLYCLITLFKRRKRAQSLIRILIAVNIFYFTYQIFWGMLYFQPPVIKKLPSQEKPEIDKAKKLAFIYLERCKKTRQSVQEDHKGRFIITNLEAIQEEILLQQTRLPTYISDKKTTRIPVIKPSLFKNVMSFTGILGYYNPFTAEAQYNSELPSTFIPFTTAHESSHQLGFAREQEANFIGYLTGIHSNNPELRYSTEYFTLKSLLRFIAEQDPKFVKSVLTQYSPAMKRDRAYEREFVFSHQGWLDDFFGLTNNLFLKSNQQEGSVTYSYFIDLLLNYEK